MQDLEAVQRCLPLLAEKSEQLAANGQAVWLNADVLYLRGQPQSAVSLPCNCHAPEVLPGPGLRGWRCSVPADAFFDAAARYCPGREWGMRGPDPRSSPCPRRPPEPGLEGQPGGPGVLH